MAPVLSPDRVRTLARSMAGAAALLLLSAASHAAELKVTAVRFWTLGEITRVAIEVSGEFTFRSDRIPDPPRAFFDIRDSQNSLQSKGVYTIPVGDKLLKQIRVAQSQAAITRVVLDLEPGVEISSSQLSNPDRLMVELRRKGAPARSADSAPGTTTLTRLEPQPEKAVKRFAAPVPAARDLTPPLIASLPPQFQGSWTIPAGASWPWAPRAPIPPPARAPERAKVKAEPKPVASAPVVTPAPSGVQEKRSLAAAEEATATGARRTSQGSQSMTRVLGLKVGRIVIDAGHGGHDTGTIGPSGLTEKSLVLDVAKRLGALLEQRMGGEVVYTRSDDTFVPLKTRTAIANQRHADLFISIHANSSPIRTTTGVETYYLNFSTTKEDLDVAARENASAQKSVFELKDMLTRIAKNDKVEESREFASKVQASMFTLAARNNPKLRNRGIKKAPFVVLIGADMPSILAEIGFISNPKEEALMKKSDHRQKVAEALYKGVSQYADTLSHFQVAQKRKP